MNDYYVFQTKPEADACIAAINGTKWFPVIGKVNGVPAPDNAMTLRWQPEPLEMLSGEWAVPRIPDKRLNALKITSATRKAFMAVFGKDVRTLTKEDFPPEPVMPL